MPSVNSVTLAGNLCHRPELRFTPKGTPIARFDLGINRRFTTDKGEKREESTFVECEVFGDTARVFADHLEKGDPVLVEGRLRLQKWEDKETGKNRSRLSVVVERWHFLSPPRPSRSTGTPPDPQEDGR
ncbi:MAG: single-stranded DNA-binding protein [Verrucomicrobiales bacterium]|nr:single-stranded DNA-binding protein [Verrucomicrobiales bacterium]